MAKNVSGRILRALRMNVWPSDFKYGCGKRSRRLVQIFRLLACSTSDATSSACHERTSQRESLRCIWAKSLSAGAAMPAGASAKRAAHAMASDLQSKYWSQARAGDAAHERGGEPEPAVDARGGDAAEVRADVAAIGDARAVAKEQAAEHRGRQRPRRHAPGGRKPASKAGGGQRAEDD